MSLKRNSNSLFLQDKEIRNQLNNLSPSTLWDLLFLNESYMTLKTNIIENLKEIYLDQDIKHEGISKDQYLKHPLRMVYFTKRYFPKSFSRIYKLILFHNILEVCDINDKVIIKVLGKEVLKYLKILTVDRKMQSNFNYLKDYYTLIVGSPECLLVKVIDKYDNLFDLKINSDINVKKNYIKEVEIFLKPRIDSKNVFNKVFLKNISYNKNLLNEK